MTAHWAFLLFLLLLHFQSNSLSLDLDVGHHDIMLQWQQCGFFPTGMISTSLPDQIYNLSPSSSWATRVASKFNWAQRRFLSAAGDRTAGHLLTSELQLHLSGNHGVRLGHADSHPSSSSPQLADDCGGVQQALKRSACVPGTPSWGISFRVWKRLILRGTSTRADGLRSSAGRVQVLVFLMVCYSLSLH